MADPKDTGGQDFLKLPQLPTTEQKPLVPTEDVQVPDISKAVMVTEVLPKPPSAEELRKIRERQSWWEGVVQDTLNRRKKGGCGCF